MDPVAVRFRECKCPDTPHDGQDGRDDGDIAYLRPDLDFVGGAETYRLLLEATKFPEPGPPGEDGKPTETYPRMMELVGPAYLRHGVVSWNLMADGKAVPCTPEAVLALPYQDAYAIADAADTLYGEAVVNPLAQRIARFSLAGKSKPRTSKRRSSKRPSRSKRS